MTAQPTMLRGAKRCSCTTKHHATSLIAVTGGPGAGKTAILEIAVAVFCEHVGVLPEAATRVFRSGFPRLDSDDTRKAAQRVIFDLQKRTEEEAIEQGELAVGLCDRGTVDGLAYWPGSSESYWQAVGASMEGELARYAAVLHLETPLASAGYNHQNKLRIESADEALELDLRILDAWSQHPRRAIVRREDSFENKTAQALELVRTLLPPCCHRHRLPHEAN